MTILNLNSSEDYYFFIKSKFVKNSIIEILQSRFNCEISRKIINHFKNFDDYILDIFSEFNLVLPHKKLKFLTTRIEENKIDYTINIINNNIIYDKSNIIGPKINEPVKTKFLQKKLKFYL